MPIIERSFLGWDAPALALAADRLVAQYRSAGGDELRLEGAVVVLPGARAGRRLAELLLERATAAGLALVPPRITTIGSLPELLYAPERPPAEGTLARLAWARALRGLRPELAARLVPHPPEPGDLVGWAALARALEHLHREVGGAGLSFAEVGARCAGRGTGGAALLFDDGARWEALAAAERSYLAELAACDRSDRESARRQALAGERLEGGEDVWLVGVPEMPPLVRRLLEAGPAPVRVLVHAPPERADAFDDAGCIVPDAWQDATIPLSDERLALCDRPADQAAEALRAIAGLGGGYAPEDVTIGVPHDEVVPYLEERLTEAGVPVRLAAGVPLPRTRPFRLLAALGDYVAGRHFAALAALLRHPDVTDWLRRHDGDREAGLAAPALGLADAYFGEHLPASVNGLPGDRGAAVDRGFAALQAALEEGLASRLEGERRLGAWAGELMGVLVEVFGGQPLDRGDPDDRQLLEACQRLAGVARALHALPGRVDATCDAAQAIRLLLAEAEREAVPPEAEGSAVELLGWLELHLDDAPALLVTGVNEPFLPLSAPADGFLPDALRSRLGLADDAARYARDAYLLSAILASRPEVRLIGGRRDAAGDPLRPSRLMFAVPGALVAERVLRFYGSAAQPAPAPAVLPARAESRFLLPPEPEIRADTPLQRLSVTDFRALLQDPYRFALERIRKVDTLDDGAAELDPLGFGSLAHAVLKAFGQSEEANLADAGRVAGGLDRLLDAEAARRFGPRALAAVGVQVEQLRARLHAFARWQADWIAAGWRIEAVEVSPPEPGLELEVDGEPFVVRGRVDRIDHHPGTGDWAIFDYKTSEKGVGPEKTHRAQPRDPSPYGERPDANGFVWLDLQLPLYRRMLPELRRADGSPVFRAEGAGEVRLGYIVLPAQDPEEEHALFAEWTEAELAHARSEVERVVRFVRQNRFVFDRARLTVWPEDPLAPLLGVGQLAALDEESDEEGGDA